MTSELRALLRLALPIAASNAGVALMGVVDTAVVGRLGAQAQGAVGLGVGLFFVVSVLGIGLVFGADPLIAQAVGAGEHERAHRLFWQASFVAAGASVVLALPLALLPEVLVPFGIDPAIARLVRTYLWARLPSLLPLLLSVAAIAYLQALGRTGPLVTSIVFANFFNLAGNLLFVFGGAGLPAWAGPLRRLPALGVVGAAVATCLALGSELGILLWAVRKVPCHAVGGAVRRVRPQRADIRLIHAVGLPIGLQMVAEVSIFTLVGLLAGRLDARSLAAHQIALALAGFTFTAALGIGKAGSVRVGLAVGARDRLGARRAGLAAFAGGAGFMACCAVVFVLAPRFLANLFTARADVLASAVPLLAVCALFQISDGVQSVGAGVLRGAGDTRFAFIANLVGHYGVGLPVAIGLGFGLGRGITGLWWGLCAGLTVVAGALFVRFWRLSGKPIAPLI